MNDSSSTSSQPASTVPAYAGQWELAIARQDEDQESRHIWVVGDSFCGPSWGGSWARCDGTYTS